MDIEEGQFWASQADALSVAFDRLTLEVSRLRDDIQSLTDEITHIRTDAKALIKKGQG